MKCFVCDYFNKTNKYFTRHFTQDQHQKTLKKIISTDTKYYCQYCGKTFTTNGNAQRHIKSTCIYKKFVIDLDEKKEENYSAEQKIKELENIVKIKTLEKVIESKDRQIDVLKLEMKRREDVLKIELELERERCMVEIRLGEKEIYKLKKENNSLRKKLRIGEDCFI